MERVVKARINALLLNLALLGVGIFYFRLRANPQAHWSTLEGHPVGGGGTFPPTGLLPALEMEIVFLAMVVLAALVFLELLAILLPARVRPRVWVMVLAQVLLVLGGTLGAEFSIQGRLWSYREENYLAPHAARYWTFNRHTTHPDFTVNSYGLRGLEIDPDRRPGEFRILCLGNSVSAGDNLSETQTYPFVMQGYLRKKCPEAWIRVQNGAVFGYSIWQGQMVFEDLVDVYKPDLVILGFSYFDVHLVDENGDPEPSHRWPFSSLRALAFESMLYMTCRQSVLAAMARTEPILPPHPLHDGTSRLQSRFNARYFRWFMRECQERGIQLVLYSPYSHSEDHFMVPGPPRPDAELVALYRRMRDPELQKKAHSSALKPDDPDLRMQDLAYLYDIPHIDIHEDWRMRPDIAQYLQDDSHPTVEGTIMQATEIGDFLLEKGLLPGVPGRPRTPGS